MAVDGAGGDPVSLRVVFVPRRLDGRRRALQVSGAGLERSPGGPCIPLFDGFEGEE